MVKELMEQDRTETLLASHGCADLDVVCLPHVDMAVMTWREYAW